MTLGESFAIFIENLSGQSSSNRRLYNRRLSGFLEIHRHREAREIGPGDINSWVATLQERGYAEATMAGYRQAVKGLFNWLVKTGAINRSPAAHIKTGSFMPQRRKLPKELDVKYCEALARLWVESGHPTKVRDGSLWLFARATGARLREILELRRSDLVVAIDHGPEEEGVYLISSTGKTGEVILRIPELEMQALEEWLQHRPSGATIDRVFVTMRKSATRRDSSLRYRPLNQSAATNIFVRLSVAAGLERPIRCHALRHRLGHLVTKQFGPKVAAMMLNHKDWKTAATAIAFYHHPDQTDVNQAIAAMSAQKSEKEMGEMAKLFGVG